ncbi:hypothetical protein RUND412_003873 [Rhizina undulata]
MSSVPDMKPRPQGLPTRPPMYRQNSAGRPFPPYIRTDQAERDYNRRDPMVLHEHGTGVYGMPPRDRMRQRSAERAMVGLPARPSPPQGRKPGQRERRHGSRNGAMSPGGLDGDRPLGPPGLKMPVAFNSIARDRGFNAGSPHSQTSPHPFPPRPRRPSGQGYHSRDPSTSAPDLFSNNENRHHMPRQFRDPPRSHPYPQPISYSNTSSTTTSPHTSLGHSSNADEIRAAFPSVLSQNEFNRSSVLTTASSEAATEFTEATDTSHAMTVDEAIGMYASDSDEDDAFSSEGNRRSHGDSVLGGATSRQGSIADDASSYRRSKGDSVLGGSSSSKHSSFAEENVRRSKGDSVLGGDVSPETRIRMQDQEAILLKEAEQYSDQESPEAKAERDDGREENKTEVEKEELNETQKSTPEINSPPDETELVDPVSESTESPVNSEEPTIETTIESSQSPLPAPIKEGENMPPNPPPEPQPKPAPEPEIELPVVEETLPVDARDRYGFRKKTQYVTLEQYNEWNSRYEETLERRKKKWDALLRESGLAPGEGGPVRFPTKSAKMKRYVRKGIPPEWRGAAWFWYAGGHKVLSKNQGVYEGLVNSGRISPDSELIERDLHRTFPDNIKFKPDPIPGQRTSKASTQPETPIVKQLRRILVAFSLHVPKIGYCQSLNFLAGLLLLFMSEEKAFWMLYIMTHTHLPGTHEVNLEGSSVDQWVLMMSVRESLPQVWSKIGGGLDGSEVEPNSTRLPPVTLCTSAWFMSGFIGSLPIESVLRVWDCLFYEGSKTLFRIALTVFKTGENQIKAVNDPMEIFQVVQTIPRKLYDAGALIEACYRRRNGFGHISQETIDQRRQDRRDTFAAERQAIAMGNVRASKDDAALRAQFTPQAHGGHDLGRKFKKILVKA